MGGEITLDKKKKKQVSEIYFPFILTQSDVHGFTALGGATV